jgi:DNA-binding HxlR family transcriptional regulator
VKRTSYAGMQCSLARSLELIGDWWNPLILRDLYLGLTRYDDLAKNLGISRNLLTTRLAALVDGGLIERRPYQRHPVRYDYVLTEAGKDLAPVLMALTAWGDRWVTPEGGPPALFEHTSCGHQFTPAVACSSCGQEVTLGDVRIRPGPGAKPGAGTALVGRRNRQPRPKQDGALAETTTAP